MVGGDYVPRNIKILRDRGRHVSIAGLRGWTTEISIFDIMRKRLVLTGSTLRPRSIAEKSIIAKALQENVWPLLSTEKSRLLFTLFTRWTMSAPHFPCWKAVRISGKSF